MARSGHGVEGIETRDGDQGPDEEVSLSHAVRISFTVPYRSLLTVVRPNSPMPL